MRTITWGVGLQLPGPAQYPETHHRPRPSFVKKAEMIV
jgi:hypothetical protein